jgi:hypothetical protein
MTPPYDKPSPTRLAIEAALGAVNPAMQLRWVKTDNLPYIHASDDEVVRPYSSPVVGRFDYMDTRDYMLAACPKNTRQLLQEHDTEVAQLKAELEVADREIGRLNGSLLTANTNAEKFEREWCLRGDELEAERERSGLCRELLSRMAYALNSTRPIMTDKASRDYAKELCDEAAAALTQTQPTLKE